MHVYIHPISISKTSLHPTNHLKTCYWVLEMCQHWIVLHDLYCLNDTTCHMPNAHCYHFTINVYNCFAWDESMSCECHDGVLWFIKSYLSTPHARCHPICDHLIRNRHYLDWRWDLDYMVFKSIKMEWCVKGMLDHQIIFFVYLPSNVRHLKFKRKIYKVNNILVYEIFDFESRCILSIWIHSSVIK